MAQHKLCCRCKTEKNFNEFYINNHKADNHNDICKKCQSEINQINKMRKKLNQFENCFNPQIMTKKEALEFYRQFEYIIDQLQWLG